MKLSTTTSKLGLVAGGLLLGLTLSEMAMRVLELGDTFSPSIKAYLFSYDRLFRRTEGGNWEAIPGARREHIRINSAGFRGADIPAPSSQTLRLAVLGDSETFAEKLPEEALLTSVLEKELQTQLNRPVQVLNFGIPGYNTAQEYQVLQKNVLPIKPNAVIVYYVLNDASLEQSAWLIPPARTYRFLHTVRLLSYFWNRPQTQTDWKSNAAEIQDQHAKNFGQVAHLLQSMAQKLEEQNIPFYVLVCPELSAFEDYAKNPFLSLHADLKKLEGKNLKVIDPLYLFESSGHPPHSFWVDNEDAHKSAEATRLIALALAERLRQNRSFAGPSAPPKR